MKNKNVDKNKNKNKNKMIYFVFISLISTIVISNVVLETKLGIAHATTEILRPAKKNAVVKAEATDQATVATIATAIDDDKEKEVASIKDTLKTEIANLFKEVSSGKTKLTFDIYNKRIVKHLRSLETQGLNIKNDLPKLLLDEEIIILHQLDKEAKESLKKAKMSVKKKKSVEKEIEKDEKQVKEEYQELLKEESEKESDWENVSPVKENEAHIYTSADGCKEYSQFNLSTKFIEFYKSCTGVDLSERMLKWTKAKPSGNGEVTFERPYYLHKGKERFLSFREDKETYKGRSKVEEVAKQFGSLKVVSAKEDWFFFKQDLAVLKGNNDISEKQGNHQLEEITVKFLTPAEMKAEIRKKMRSDLISAINKQDDKEVKKILDNMNKEEIQKIIVQNENADKDSAGTIMDQVYQLWAKAETAGEAQKASTNIIAMLVNKGSALPQKLDKNDSSGSPLIHSAAVFNNLELLKMIIKHVDGNINALSKQGTSVLLTAIKFGSKEVAEFLLDNNAKINVKNELSENEFYRAIAYKQPEMVKLLLNHKNSKDTIKLNTEDYKGNLAIHYLITEEFAGDNRPKEIMQIILDSGRVSDVFINSQKKNDYTLLMMAANNGYTGLVDLLLNHPQSKDLIDVNVVNELGQTAIDLASNEAIKELLNKYYKTHENARVAYKSKIFDNALAAAKAKIFEKIKSSDFAGLAQILDDLKTKSMDINGDKEHFKKAMLALTNESGENMLVQAMNTWVASKNKNQDKEKNPQYKVIAGLLKAGMPFDENMELRKYRDESATTILSWAAYYNDENTVKTILSQMNQWNPQKKKDYLNAGDKNNVNALMEASVNGHSKIVDLFLAAGANVNNRSSYGNTPIYSAILQGHKEVVSLLENYYKEHPDLWAQKLAGDLELAIAAQDLDKVTNVLKEVQSLKNKSDIPTILTSKDKDGNSLAQQAVLKWTKTDSEDNIIKSMKILNALVKAGVKLDEDIITLGNTPKYKQLVSDANLLLSLAWVSDVDDLQKEIFTRLEAYKLTNPKEALGYINLKANKEYKHRTPLLIAIQNNNKNTSLKQIFVDELIKLGADVNPANSNNGATPLTYAAYHGETSIVKSLLNVQGIEVNARETSGSDAGKNALEIAEARGKTEAAAEIRKYLAEKDFNNYIDIFASRAFSQIESNITKHNLNAIKKVIDDFTKQISADGVKDPLNALAVMRKLFAIKNSSGKNLTELALDNWMKDNKDKATKEIITYLQKITR
ncbi:MAG: ankyrin repeat domain-containing protein [Oligoflexia bacterium]|nr:ankyrin repeat domain-containing protein [Oligoflexia bacterium]